MNNSKNKQLHMLLSQTGLTPHKAALVAGFSGGRTESSTDLTDTEAERLIAHLRQQLPKAEDPADKMRKKMIHYARSMNWEIEVSGKRKADMERLDNWCIHYGQFHKPLMEHEYNELVKLVSQFDVVYKAFLKGL